MITFDDLSFEVQYLSVIDSERRCYLCFGTSLLGHRGSLIDKRGSIYRAQSCRQPKGFGTVITPASGLLWCHMSLFSPEDTCTKSFQLYPQLIKGLSR